MPKSAVTICLVEEASQGPFVFHDGLSSACAHAQNLGFDGVEVFAPSASAVSLSELEQLSADYQLEVSAFGTGAGALLHGFNLSSSDAQMRTDSLAFVKEIIDLGAHFSAPAIIGSMQGSYQPKTTKEQTLDYLREALSELGRYAETKNVPLIFEPINRYESNLFARDVVQGPLSLLKSLQSDNVRLLADLFHFNIETPDIAQALRQIGDLLGHLHFVDNTRNPAGSGSIDYTPVARALTDIGYQGYLSAEAFPYPDSLTAAKQTISCFRDYFSD